VKRALDGLIRQPARNCVEKNSNQEKI